MKFVSFEHSGETGYGVVLGETITRLDTLRDAPTDLKSYIEKHFDTPFHELPTHAGIPLGVVKLLPPIPNPGKVFCVATNFHEPARKGKPDPDYPLLFTRVAEAQTGHNSPILKPAVSEKFDFEGELAVIIGKSGHQITREKSMDHVFGYSCFNDGSVRDWQKHSTQFTPGKNFFQSAGFGPWIVCTQEISDPSRLTLETRVNNIVKQSISMRQMIFDIPWLISYISTFSPLAAGDVIVTGTPSGFGSTRKPQEFLFEGDLVDVEISSIGTLSNTVKQHKDPRDNFRN